MSKIRNQVGTPKKQPSKQTPRLTELVNKHFAESSRNRARETDINTEIETEKDRHL